jgi:hypothetical protein
MGERLSRPMQHKSGLFSTFFCSFAISKTERYGVAKTIRLCPRISGLVAGDR